MGGGLAGDVRPNEAVVAAIVMSFSTAKSRVAILTELDSHANMVVLGRFVTIIRRTGRSVDVQAFAEDVPTMKSVPIVDAVVAHDCPYTSTTTLLVFTNALYVPSMEHNLIPPFIMREAGLIVNEVPKFQMENPTSDDHAIIDPVSDVRINLTLQSTFSGFPTRELTRRELANVQDYTKVWLTPRVESWDPYDEFYADQERSLIDNNGELRLDRTRPRKKSRVDEHLSEDELFGLVSNVQVKFEDGYVKSVPVDFVESIIDLNLSRYADESAPSIYHVPEGHPTRAPSAPTPSVESVAATSSRVASEPPCGYPGIPFAPPDSVHGNAAGRPQFDPSLSPWEADREVLHSSVGSPDTPVRTASSLYGSGAPGLGRCAAATVLDDEPTMIATLQQHARHAAFTRVAGATSVSHEADELFRSHHAEEPLMRGDLPYDVQHNLMEDIFDDCFCEDLGEFVARAEYVIGAVTAGQVKDVPAELLANVWQIKESDAERTLRQTTRRNTQSLDSTLSRQFGTNDRMLRYQRLDSIFFTDTLKISKKCTSYRGNTCAQVFVSDKGYIYVCPMRKESDYYDALKQFSKKVGAPEILVCDGSKTQKKREVKEYLNKIGTRLRVLEQRTQWANRAELWIGIMKEAVRRDLRMSHSPLVFWDYCLERRALIINATARDNFKLQGQTPHMTIHGREPDISNLLFGWFEWVYYLDDSEKFPYPRECLGRCLGPSLDEGNEMAQWILAVSGEVISRRTLRRLTREEISPTNEDESYRRRIFMEHIYKKRGTSYQLPCPSTGEQIADDIAGVDEVCWKESPFDLGAHEEGTPDVPDADIVDEFGKPVSENALTDLLIGAEILLPEGETTDGKFAAGKVIRQCVDTNGVARGQHNDNPLFSTRAYDVLFEDGRVREYSANVIAENVLAMADSSGHLSCEMESIVSHQRNGDAVSKEDAAKSKCKGLFKTTKGWALLVKFKEGTTRWIDLKDAKQANPVMVANYAFARDLEDEPAFAWWVPYTLRKADAIVKSVTSRITSKTHKYGIEVPRSFKEAMALDAKNGNDLWRKAYLKEMSQVNVAFEFLARGERAPEGWKKASGHIVWDVKMDFTRKARWVKDGHRTAAPESSSYAGVVSRESIRIALTYAALHGLPVVAADIRNAYLSAPSSEKHFIICGPEFGEHEGCVALIRRALYGGKAAGRDYWHYLRKIMHKDFGFQSSRGDPDVWFREARRADTNELYYEYVLLYTDDILVVSERAEDIIRGEIGRKFMLKEESIGPPSQYLGGKLSLVELVNGRKAWSFSSAQYVKEAVANAVKVAKSIGMSVPGPRNSTTPISRDYRPEIDTTTELTPDLASHYYSLIGVLRWIVELGRVDICVEVSMLSAHLALPRQGHLEQVFHIIGYLKHHHNACMVFDPTEWDIPEGMFEKEDWSFSPYGCEDLQEELPPNMPKAYGREMRIRVFVDSDHAGDSLTRRSRTGFVVFLNSAPIYWFSKKQTSCETSTYGAEFVAMKAAMEYVRGLRYKLRMMGIPVSQPAYVLGDNQSVLANTSNPGSVLKKKSAAIAYCFVREGCARDEWRTAYINTNFNVADLFTKPLPAGEKRDRFISCLLQYVVRRAE